MIYVKGGGITLRNCQLSCGFVMKSSQYTIPMLLLSPNTNNMVSGCKFYGSETINSTGIVAKSCACTVRDSYIEGFLKIGVVMW